MPENIDVLLLAHPETDALSIVRFLEDAGYRPNITEIRSRAELDDALKHPRDLFLGDPGLGGLTPAELVGKLRTAPGSPPFIAFAPGLTHEQGTDAVRVGAFDYFAEADLARQPSTVMRAFRDHTARREWTTALHESGRAKAMQRELFRNSPEAIAVLEDGGRIVEVNPAFETLFGYSQSEARGSTIRQLIVPDDKLREHEDIVSQVASGSIARMESIRRRKDGGEVRVSTIAIPVEMGGGTLGIYAIYSDITARMRALDALRRAESNYRNFFMNAVEGMYVSSPLGRFVLANPALADLLGYDSPSEVTDSVRSISREIYAEPGHRERFLDAMRASDVLRNFPARIKRKDGREVDIVENVRAIRDDDGDLLYYQGTMAKA